MLYITYCRQYRNANNNKIIQRYSLPEGREAWEHGGSEIERGKKGGPATCDLGQVRVGTRFALDEDDHICQQFVVDFGRVSVNTDARLGEPSKVLVFRQTSKPFQYGGTFRVHLDCHKMI